jgi:hypothetical protein
VLEGIDFYLDFQGNKIPGELLFNRYNGGFESCYFSCLTKDIPTVKSLLSANAVSRAKIISTKRRNDFTYQIEVDCDFYLKTHELSSSTIRLSKIDISILRLKRQTSFNTANQIEQHAPILLTDNSLGLAIAFDKKEKDVYFQVSKEISSRKVSLSRILLIGDGALLELSDDDWPILLDDWRAVKE